MKKKETQMKRALFIVLLVMILTLVIACKSQPKTTEESFKSVYDRYRKNLILDDAQKYTVVSGDTLSAISRGQYQNGFYFPVIMMASSDVVLDPDEIELAMELTIPDIQKNLDDPKARTNIKNFLLDVAKIEDDRSRPQDAEGLRNLANSL